MCLLFCRTIYQCLLTLGFFTRVRLVVIFLFLRLTPRYYDFSPLPLSLNRFLVLSSACKLMESNRIQKSRVTAILRTSFFRKKEKTNERIRRDRSGESKIRKTFESFSCYETRGGKINPIVISFGINEGVRFFRPLF